MVAQTAMGHFTGSTPLNMSEDQIEDALVSRATNPASPLLSDVANLSLDDARRDGPPVCDARACRVVITDAIPPQQSEIVFSLDSFGNTPEFNSELTAFDREYEPVMNYRGVSLAQARAAGQAPDGTVFHYQSYGGWLEHSVFAVQTSTGGIRGNEQGVLLFSYSFGDLSNSDPTTTATWTGMMVGRNIDTDDVIHGEAEIVFNMTDLDILDSVEFSSVRNLSSASPVTFGNDSSLRFENIPLVDDGTFTKTDATLGNIRGRFYGASHEEVGGVFDSYNIIGAFGANR